jgi:hypothetical protein
MKRYQLDFSEVEAIAVREPSGAWVVIHDEKLAPHNQAYYVTLLEQRIRTDEARQALAKADAVAARGVEAVADDTQRHVLVYVGKHWNATTLGASSDLAVTASGEAHGA